MFVVSTICDGARHFSEEFSKAGLVKKLQLIPVIGGVASVCRAARCIIFVLEMARPLLVAKVCAVFDPDTRRFFEQVSPFRKILLPLLLLEIGECLFAQIPVISNLYFAGRGREDRAPWRPCKRAMKEESERLSRIKMEFSEA